LAVFLVKIEAGKYGGYGGYGGNGGYGDNGGYGGNDYGGKEEVKEGIKDDLPVDGGKYDFGIKDVVIKPAVYKPPVIPYVKPVIKSYQKFAQPYGYQGYGYGGYPGGNGKVIPLTKLFEYQPKFDINPYLKPYEGAHLLQKYDKPMVIVKHAPPVYIRQPPIEKTIIKKVFVEQPVIIKEQPVIQKSKTVTIKKKPAIVNIDEKAPVDVKDFGQTAVLKNKGPVLPKEPGFQKGVEYDQELSRLNN